MPILLKNVIVATARTSYDAATKVTSPAAAYLSGVPGHMSPMTSGDYTKVSEAALKADYVLSVEYGADITTDDTLTSVVDIRTGNAYPTDSPNATWSVVDAIDSAPGPLQHRLVYLERVIASGPSHR